MDDILSPSQTLVIYALLSRQGFAPQNDLGVPVDATEREALESQKLISTIKREQNALWLRLEDAGWDWAQAHMTKALPSTQMVLHYFMVRLDAHLKQTGESLRDFIGELPGPGPLDPGLSTEN